MPSTTTAPRAVDVRRLQFARAVLAAIAAAMIAFTADHSAAVGLAVFGGWAVTTGLVEVLAAWLVRRPAGGASTGPRWPATTLGVVTLLAGLAAGIVAWRSTTTFFVVVIAWALVSGVLELAVSWRAARRERRAGARATAPTRDGLVVGAVTVLLGLGLLLVQPGYELEYTIPAAGRAFSLTGIAIAVGVFGGYAAVVAVYLGIAGLSPRSAADAATDVAAPDAAADAASALPTPDAAGRAVSASGPVAAGARAGAATPLPRTDPGARA